RAEFECTGAQYAPLTPRGRPGPIMSLARSERQAAWFTDDAEPEATGSRYAGVVFNRPLDQVFTYRVPARLREVVRPGQRVRVPLGGGNQPPVGSGGGVDGRARGGGAPGKIKGVLEGLDDPPLIDPAMLELTRWLAGYYACSWGQALDAAVPAGVKKQAGTRVSTFLTVPEAIRQAHATATLPQPPLTSKQAEALAILCRSSEPLSMADVCGMAKCAPGPIAALRRRGYVHTVRRRLRPVPPGGGVAGDDTRPDDATATEPARPAPTDEQRA